MTISVLPFVIIMAFIIVSSSSLPCPSQTAFFNLCLIKSGYIAVLVCVAIKASLFAGNWSVIWGEAIESSTGSTLIQADIGVASNGYVDQGTTNEEHMKQYWNFLKCAAILKLTGLICDSIVCIMPIMFFLVACLVIRCNPDRSLHLNCFQIIKNALVSVTSQTLYSKGSDNVSHKSPVSTMNNVTTTSGKADSIDSDSTSSVEQINGPSAGDSSSREDESTDMASGECENHSFLPFSTELDQGNKARIGYTVRYALADGEMKQDPWLAAAQMPFCSP